MVAVEHCGLIVLDLWTQDIDSIIVCARGTVHTLGVCACAIDP